MPFLDVLVSPPGHLQQCQCISYSHTRCARISTIWVHIRLIRATPTGGRATTSPTRYRSSQALLSQLKAASICRHIARLTTKAHAPSLAISRLSQPGSAHHSTHPRKRYSTEPYSINTKGLSVPIMEITGPAPLLILAVTLNVVYFILFICGICWVVRQGRRTKQIRRHVAAIDENLEAIRAVLTEQAESRKTK